MKIFVVIIPHERLGVGPANSSFGMDSTIYITSNCIREFSQSRLAELIRIGGAPLANPSFDMTMTKIFKAAGFP